MDTVSHGAWTFLIMQRYLRRWYFVLSEGVIGVIAHIEKGR